MQNIIDYLGDDLTAIVIFAAVWVAFYILKAVILGRVRAFASKTKNNIDDLFVALLQSLNWPLAVALSTFAASFFVTFMTPNLSLAVQLLLIVVITYQIARFVNVIFKWVQDEMAEAGTPIISGFRTMLVVVVWIIGIIFAILTLGYDVTSLVAGLGIGGIAVALAVQNILGDVFGSISIFFDKPFAVGDYIQVGDKDGVVEKVGMKTTRIRSLRGELIVISNKELTNSVVQNFGALERRRIVVEYGLEYSTPNEQINAFQKKLQELVELEDKLTFDRCFFKSFGDSALIVELVFFVESGEFIDYANAQHALNLKIKTFTEEHGISMAFPTQTVHVKNES